MTISLRLNEAMNRAGIGSQSELARRSGVPQPTINRILNRGGRQGPATETIKKLAAACSVPFQWLADATGAELPAVSGEEPALPMSRPQYDVLPGVLGSNLAEKAAGSVAIKKVKVDASPGPAEFLLCPEEKTGEAVYLERAWLRRRGYDDRMLIALAMVGESMEPCLYDGDTLIANLADKMPCDGEVFVFNYEGTVLIRRLMRDARNWWLSSDNSDQRRFRRKQYSAIDCKIIGRVVYRFSEKI